MQCESCKAEIDANNRFCHSCGNPILAIITNPESNNSVPTIENNKKPVRGLGAIGWLLMTLCVISMLGLVASTILGPTPSPRNYTQMAIGSAFIGGLIARYYRRSIILWAIISFFAFGFLFTFATSFIRGIVH